MELHVFSDASVKAIAAVAYLKVLYDNGVYHVGFVIREAKLAPMSVHAVPRLELGAAVLAVKIAELSRELDVKLEGFRFYTNSKVVLGYIKMLPRGSLCMSVIGSNTLGSSGALNSGTNQNPADVVTRSVPAGLLSNTN